MGSKGLWVVNAREVCILTKQNTAVNLCMQPDVFYFEMEQALKYVSDKVTQSMIN